MAEWKLPCTINKQFHGLAHVIEQVYDKDFKTWYGAIGVSSREEFDKLMYQDIFVQLDDGRIGRARVMCGHSNIVSTQEIENETLGELHLLYVVGISALTLPPQSGLPATR